MTKQQGGALLEGIKNMTNQIIGGMTEGLENGPAPTSNSGSLKSAAGVPNLTADQQAFIELQTKFDKALDDYSTAYNAVVSELTYNYSKPELEKYAGKNVLLKIPGKDENIYYVNNYGVTHGYSNQAWEGKHPSCPTDYEDITETEFNNLIKGPNMGVGQPCNIAGHNVKNTENNMRAWVDIKGVRHGYAGNWATRPSSCQSEGKPISKDAFNSIPESNVTVSPNFYCNNLNVSPNHLKELAKVNGNLISLAQNIISKTSNLTTSDVSLKAQLNSLGIKATNLINSLEQDKLDLNNMQYTLSDQPVTQEIYSTNVKGVKQSSQYKLSSNYLQFIFWLILLIFLIIYSSYAFSSSEVSTTSAIIIVIVAVFLLYRFGKYIKDKLF